MNKQNRLVDTENRRMVVGLQFGGWGEKGEGIKKH